MFLAELPETILLPSGENETENTPPPCSSIPRHYYEFTSQIFRVLSPLPETILLPSGENATEKTFPSCPSNIPTP